MSFDRIAATLAALAVVGLVIFLLIRNEPIADARLFFALRLIMSFAAAALGATVPGFLDVKWKGAGLVVRATGALALFVITFVSTPDLVKADEHASENNHDIIGAGRDINATSVTINVVKFPYLKDKALMNNALRSGWSGVHVDLQQVVEQNEDALAILPTGNVEHYVQFTLASKAGANIVVDSLSLNLKSYEKCGLRDETSEILGYMGQVNKSYFISENFDKYPITPLNPDLNQSVWQYKGGDSDSFSINVEFQPYILYLVTVSADYKNLVTGHERHIESDQYALIDVANGNWGGCLDIKRWFDKSKEQMAADKSYDDGIPYDIYQLLTANLNRDPGLLNIFLRSQYLRTRKSVVQKIVNDRPDNGVFKTNYKIWIDAIGQTGTNP